MHVCLCVSVLTHGSTVKSHSDSHLKSTQRSQGTHFLHTQHAHSAFSLHSLHGNHVPPLALSGSVGYPCGSARARAHAHRYLHSSAINGLSHAFNIFTKILNAWHHGIMLVDLHCTISLRHTVNTRRRRLKWQCCALLCFLHFICRGQNWALFSIKPNDSFKNSCFVTTHTMNIGPPISTKSPSLGFKPYWPPLPPTKSSESICCYELRWWRKAKRRRSRESSWVKHHRKTFFFFF